MSSWRPVPISYHPYAPEPGPAETYMYAPQFADKRAQIRADDDIRQDKADADKKKFNLFLLAAGVLGVYFLLSRRA